MDVFSRDIMEPILAFMRLHAAWAPLILFSVMMLEGIILTTFLFSGVVIILATGALIKSGVLPYGPVYLAIFLGFWAGDTINFMIGQRGENWFRNLAMVKSRANLVEKAEGMIKNWGAAAIFVSRFLGPSRPFVTFLAGTFRLQSAAFHGATMLSTAILVWGLLNAGMTGVELFNKIQIPR
jgi:membrane protein DedA with SNARE-associated domain